MVRLVDLTRYLSQYVIICIWKVFRTGGCRHWMETCVMKDPICGMNVDETTAKYKSDHKGRKYVFCSSMCKEEFEKNPEKY
jgi:YHS domain-containing protein